MRDAIAFMLEAVLAMKAYLPGRIPATSSAPCGEWMLAQAAPFDEIIIKREREIASRA
jgi:hypothetical protein